MISYKRASLKDELAQILELQRENLPEVVSEEIQKKEGFVTVHHDFNILKRMNEVCPHIIAVSGKEVVGYALCMHPKFGNEIAVLRPMFSEIDKVLEPHEPFIVMGQVCVAKEYRKQGIFRGLYREMLAVLQPEYKCVITEVDVTNTRSLEAHYAIGFTLLSSYQSDGRDWELIQLK